MGPSQSGGHPFQLMLAIVCNPTRDEDQSRRFCLGFCRQSATLSGSCLSVWKTFRSKFRFVVDRFADSQLQRDE